MVGVEANDEKGELEQGVVTSGSTAKDDPAREAGWKHAESVLSNPEQELESSAIKIQALARGRRDRKQLKAEAKPAKQDSTKKFGGSSLNLYNKGPLRVLHKNPATSGKPFQHTEFKQGHDELESSAIRIQALARGNKERERLKMDAPETEGKGKLEKDNEAPETEGKDKLENGNEVETVPEEQLLRQKKFVK